MIHLRIIKLLLAFALAGAITLQAEEPYNMDWVKQFGVDGHDFAYGVATDTQDNIYVTGMAGEGTLDGDPVNNGDAYLRKYSSEGTLLWSRLFDTSSYEEGHSVATDRSGNVFICGFTYGVLNGGTSLGDAFIAKYSSDGLLIWSKQFGSGRYNYANNIRVDSGGNLLISGFKSYYGRFSGYGVVTKFSNDGVLLWTRDFGLGSYEIAAASVTDELGNVYVTGKTAYALNGETAIGSFDAFLLKYSSDGALIWTKLFGSTDSDVPFSIAIDNSGNLVISGYTYGSFAGETNSGRADIFVSKFDTNGSHIWSREFGSSNTDSANSVTVDSSDNIYVAGYTHGTLNGAVRTGLAANAFITKFSSSGTHLWNKQFGTPDSRYYGTPDSANSIAVDSKNTLLVAGSTGGSFDGIRHPGAYDSFLAKFSSPNTAPVAVAAALPQAVVLNGTTVTLDASQSYDPDADNITYVWNFVQTPLNSTAMLSDTSSINPTFMPDLKGDYILSLDVTDAFGASAHTEITVSFDNIKPVADTDVNQSVVSDYPIYLNGSASSDANGDTLSYNWEILSQPAESSAVILDPIAAMTSLNADEEGVYTLSLTVNDGTIDSDPANLSIEIITPLTAAKRLIQQAITDVQALPDSSFKNAKRKKALLKKLMVIVKMLNSSKYEKAVHKLSHDILPKVEDDEKKGWVITPELSSVYALISQAVIYLQSDDEDHHKAKKYDDNDDEDHHKGSRSDDNDDEHDKD